MEHTRSRVLLWTVCQRPCAATPSATVFGLPPSLCRGTEYYSNRSAAAAVSRRRSIIVDGLPPLRRSCFVVLPRRAHCLLFWCCRCCCYCLVFGIPAAWSRSSAEIHGIAPAAYSQTGPQHRKHSWRWQSATGRSRPRSRRPTLERSSPRQSRPRGIKCLWLPPLLQFEFVHASVAYDLAVEWQNYYGSETVPRITLESLWVGES